MAVLERTLRLRLAGGGARLRLRALGDWESRPLDAVAEASRASGAVEKFLRHAVGRSREQGCSWADIGRALGTTRQAAWERFSEEE